MSLLACRQGSDRLLLISHLKMRLQRHGATLCIRSSLAASITSAALIAIQITELQCAILAQAEGEGKGTPALAAGGSQLVAVSKKDARLERAIFGLTY